MFQYTHIYCQVEFTKKVFNRYSFQIEKEYEKYFNDKNNRTKYQGCNFTSYEMLCIGKYEKALKLSDAIGSPQFSFIDSINNIYKVENLQSEYTKTFIINKLNQSKIIILNEDHNQPIHRVFAKSILKDLYNSGFHYLAIEALNNDSTINIKKKLTKNDGFYTNEPQFSNFIKEALELGFIIIQYEASLEELENREYYQAKHIKEKVFDKDSTAKLFIYCGFGHGDETPIKDSIGMMGAWLSKITNINPTTFDQVTLTEHSKKDNEYTSYSFFNKKESSIFFYENFTDSTFVPFDGITGYDYYIYHPRTIYSENRPNWLFDNAQNVKYYIETNLKRNAYPILILAYDENDYSASSIPIDAIECISRNDKKPLSLKKGQYKIAIKSRNSKTGIIEKKVEIK